MRFGAFVPQGWRLDLVTVEPGVPQYRRMRECALELERLGYDSLWLYDHFHTIPEALPEATFEVWTACTALAEATSTIRLGQMCGCNMYRPPALLAKMTSNIDVISEGRLEFGLGAGWYHHETVAYGYRFDKPAVRIGQLDEAVQIIKGLWTQGRFAFEGKYYTIGKGTVRDYRGQTVELDGALNYPQPVQKPHPPLWIAGGGEQLTLRTVARYADYSNYMGSLKTIRHKNAVLDAHCERQGRDPSAVRRTTNINVFFGDDDRLEALLEPTGRDAGDIQAVKRMLFPREPSQLVERLARYRDEGRIDYVIVYFLDMGQGDSAQRFAEEVIPALR